MRDKKRSFDPGSSVPKRPVFNDLQIQFNQAHMITPTATYTPLSRDINQGKLQTQFL